MDQPLQNSDIYRQLLEQGGKEIPEDVARLFAPAVVWIKEWQDYWIKLPGVDQLRVGTLELSAQHDNWFRLRFENQLGLARLQPLAENRVLSPGATVEVISPKFDTLTRHHRFYKILLDDLFQRAVHLPFAIQAFTHRSIQEALQSPTPLFTLHFLCQHAAELSAALAIILVSPHRLLIDEDALVSLAAVRSVDADVIMDIFQNSSRWVKTSGHPLAEKLGGYVPSHVWQHLPNETFDTPENRFVLNFLNLLLNAIDDLVFQPWWKIVPEVRRDLLQELRILLQQAIVHPVFEEVSEQLMLPLNSQVLLRRDGYRQMLSLWQQFHQARKPLFQPLQKAIDMRSVAELYEYWAFFTLAERIGYVLAINPQFELKMSDEHGLNWLSQASFGGSGRLVFNRKFTPNNSSFDSYSTTMRPDFAWVVDNKSNLVFDAKFSFNAYEWGAGEEESEHQTIKRPKLDNLYKMHTYRDALGIKAAVIIYPGDTNVFYDPRQKPHKLEEFTLGQLLQGELTGIGALAMQPGRLE